MFVKRLSLHPWVDIAIVAVGSSLALALRLSLLPFESGDYFLFFRDWYLAFQREGFVAVATLKYDYTPSYLYLLYVVSALFPKVISAAGIKLPAVAFDFLSAYLIFRIVRLKYPSGPAAIFAYFVVLFAPTIVLNSAVWGQSESIFTAFLLICLYFLLIDRGALAGLAFGAAFAFKLQAIFLLPLLLGLAIKGKFAWKHFLWTPLVYLVLMIPAWFAGRSMPELVRIYVEQTQSYPALSLNAPTLYAWLPEPLYNVFYRGGLIWAAGAVFLYLLAVYKSRAPMTQSLILSLGLLSVLFFPFCLPKMHERYFYPADMLAIAYAFYFPEHFFVPILMGVVSFFAYQPFLFGRQIISTGILAVGVLILLVLVARKVMNALYQG